MNWSSYCWRWVRWSEGLSLVVIWRWGGLNGRSSVWAWAVLCWTECSARICWWLVAWRRRLEPRPVGRERGTQRWSSCLGSSRGPGWRLRRWRECCVGSHLWFLQSSGMIVGCHIRSGACVFGTDPGVIVTGKPQTHLLRIAGLSWAAWAIDLNA